jgi:deoxyhypusine synthase
MKDSLIDGRQMIEPLPIAKGQKVNDFVDKVFAKSGYNARRLGEACKLYKKMLNEDVTVCLTLAGAMTPIGMSGPIIKLIENGFIDWIISTGANLYHDLHRTFNYPMVQGDFRADDDHLYKHGIARIYDVFVADDDTLFETDQVIRRAIKLLVKRSLKQHPILKNQYLQLQQSIMCRYIVHLLEILLLV